MTLLVPPRLPAVVRSPGQAWIMSSCSAPPPSACGLGRLPRLGCMLSRPLSPARRLAARLS